MGTVTVSRQRNGSKRYQGRLTLDGMLIVAKLLRRVVVWSPRQGFHFRACL